MSGIRIRGRSGERGWVQRPLVDHIHHVGLVRDQVDEDTLGSFGEPAYAVNDHVKAILAKCGAPTRQTLLSLVLGVA